MHIRSIPILCVAIASFTACGGDTTDTTDVTSGGYAGDTGETSVAKGGSTLASSKSTKLTTGGAASKGGTSGEASEPSTGGVTSTEPTTNGGTTVTAASSTGGATSTQPSGGSSTGGSSAGGTTSSGNTKTGGNSGKGGTSSTSSALGGTSATGTGGATTSSGGLTAKGGATASGGTTAAATTSTCAVTYYQDADGDTWGGTVTACTGGSGWVTRTGDCNDANVNVFPSQSASFTEGYTTGTGLVSFDYNCDGDESTTGSVRESTGTCTASTSGTSCSGDGYLPVAPVRAGTNLDQLCGSTLYLACTRSQQQCIETLFTDDTYDAVRCR